jgi:glycosyltransferase involved in cell wall biosynthesis
VSTPITFCITELDPGGAERALVRLVSGLDRQRWNPTVICLGPRAELVIVLEDAGIKVTCLNVTSQLDIGVIVRLRRELKRIRPQLLQTFLFHANIAGRIAAKTAGVPHVVSGIRVAERRSKWPLRIDRWTQCLVDRHVCVSQSVADYSIHEAGLDANKVLAINNGVDCDAISQATATDLSEFGIPDNSKVMLFVGRLDPQKAPDVLLKAVQKVIDHDTTVHAILVGEGVLSNELRTLTSSLSLESHVHFVGRQSNVAGLMKACDMLVLPSLWEGLPNVVLEAMAAGLPVVATAVDGTREVIEHGKTGLLIQPGVVDELANTIRRILENEETARTMARAAQTLVKERFTWKSCVAAYDKLYSELIASDAEPRHRSTRSDLF